MTFSAPLPRTTMILNPTCWPAKAERQSTSSQTDTIRDASNPRAIDRVICRLTSIPVPKRPRPQWHSRVNRNGALAGTVNRHILLNHYQDGHITTVVQTPWTSIGSHNCGSAATRTGPRICIDSDVRTSGCPQRPGPRRETLLRRSV